MDKKHGKGKEYYNNGKLKFEGEYKDGERHGYGEEHYYNTGGLKFKGQYNNGNKWNGEGYDEYGDVI